MAHIVWDWNGTLLDDQAVVLGAVNASLAAVGWRPITLDDYRTHYTRPVKVFYERLAERTLDPDEWHEIDELFHAAYQDQFGGVRLAGDAEQALSEHLKRGRTQSLLSMYPHDELVTLVEHFRLTLQFDRVDGHTGTRGTTKAASLRRHLDLLDKADVVVVGDTPDDAAAAQINGVPCVVYDGGSHHRRELDALGVPVVDSLVEAVDLAPELAGTLPNRS